MGVGLTLFILFNLLLLIGGIIYAIALLRKDKDEMEDNPFFINFAFKYSKGRAYGVQKNITSGKNGRQLIRFAPRDVRPENMEVVKDKIVVIDKSKLIHLPKGTWSNEKNVVIGLPPHAEDLPDPLKKTIMGKSIGLTTEIINAVNSEIDMIREGSRRKDEVLSRLGDGELSREHLITIDELIKDMVKIATDVKSKPKDSGLGEYGRVQGGPHV